MSEWSGLSRCRWSDFGSTLRLVSLFAFAAGLVSSLGASTREPSQEIQELMTEAEFRSAGLHQLTPEQLFALNAWLYGYVEKEREAAVEDAIPSGEPSFGLEQVTTRVAAIFQRDTPDAVESRIVGDFRGWRGNTVFRLENGQVWRQVAPGEFFVRLENPTVHIRRATFGSYLLSVEGYGSNVRVRRVE